MEIAASRPVDFAVALREGSTGEWRGHQIQLRLWLTGQPASASGMITPMHSLDDQLQALIKPYSGARWGSADKGDLHQLAAELWQKASEAFASTPPNRMEMHVDSDLIIEVVP